MELYNVNTNGAAINVVQAHVDECHVYMKMQQKALEDIKRGLMHQRRFGADTIDALRSAAADAEGTAADALLPDNAALRGGEGIQLESTAMQQTENEK